ncbi:hypothetical protein A2U01_0048853, partial [Trifolium medium]|nr:hypothetical protein [Trifolium medium]
WRVSEDTMVELGVPNISDMKIFYGVRRNINRTRSIRRSLCLWCNRAGLEV